MDLSRLHSSGSLATYLFETLGLVPPFKKFRVDPIHLGRAISAQYGGLTGVEMVRLRHEVVSFDAPSMYALVAYLLNVCRQLAAAHIRVRSAHVAEQVARPLASPTLRCDLRSRVLWRQLGFTFVAVRPRGQRLPAKGRYNPSADEYLLACNPLFFDGALWFHWADVASAVIATGQKPEILDAIRFESVGIQDGLRRARIRGGPWIDLAQGDDLYVALVAARDRIKRSRQPRHERERAATTIKLVTEAAAFGQLARFDPPVDRSGGTVYGPWGPRATPTPLERPGPWCWPPAAAGVCAGARLLQALGRLEAEEAGWDVVAYDTDALTLTRRAGS